MSSSRPHATIPRIHPDYLNFGRAEQRLFDQAVTCWERERLDERG